MKMTTCTNEHAYFYVILHTCVNWLHTSTTNEKKAFKSVQVLRGAAVYGIHERIKHISSRDTEYQ